MGPNAVGISGFNNGKSSNHSRGSEATTGAVVNPFEASEKVLHIDTSLVLLEQSEAKKHLSMILGVTAGVNQAMGFEFEILLQLLGIGKVSQRLVRRR